MRKESKYVRWLDDARSALTGVRAAFLQPFASHQWGSARAKRHWSYLEVMQDQLAGPPSAAGGCRYVYERDDVYFRGVTNPESLRTRLLEWHGELSAGVDKFEPRTSQELADFSYMKSLVEKLGELIEALIALERKRFES